MVDELLNQPIPIIFAVCQGWQQLANGAVNLLGVFDGMTVQRLPDIATPDTVSLTVFTQWTGGQGSFTRVLRLLDPDGQQIGELRIDFALPNPAHRHSVISSLGFPVRAGVFTLLVGRGEEEMLRQTFTITIVDATQPGT